jgi:hypothetical protein
MFLLILFYIYECRYGMFKLIQTTLESFCWTTTNTSIRSLFRHTYHEAKLRLCAFDSMVRASLHHRLAPQSTVLHPKLTVLQLSKKFPAFYSTRRFIAPILTARHLSLLWARLIHSKLRHSIHFTYGISSSNLRLLVPNAPPTSSIIISNILSIIIRRYIDHIRGARWRSG